MHSLQSNCARLAHFPSPLRTQLDLTTFAQVFCSPLRRAQQTASIIWEGRRAGKPQRRSLRHAAERSLHPSAGPARLCSCPRCARWTSTNSRAWSRRTARQPLEMRTPSGRETPLPFASAGTTRSGAKPAPLRAGGGGGRSDRLGPGCFGPQSTLTRGCEENVTAARRQGALVPRLAGVAHFAGGGGRVRRRTAFSPSGTEARKAQTQIRLDDSVWPSLSVFTGQVVAHNAVNQALLCTALARSASRSPQMHGSALSPGCPTRDCFPTGLPGYIFPAPGPG